MIAGTPCPSDVTRSLYISSDFASTFLLEQAYRRKGLALEALRLILQYATSPTLSVSNSPLPVSPTSLVVRIGASNQASISLFTRLGFSVSKHVEVFDEVEMKFAYDPATGEHIDTAQLVQGWADSPMEELHLSRQES